jgi:hypothetical protein
MTPGTRQASQSKKESDCRQTFTGFARTAKPTNSRGTTQQHKTTKLQSKTTLNAE